MSFMIITEASDWRGGDLKPKFYYLDNPPVTPFEKAEVTTAPAQSTEVKLPADMKVGDEVLFGRYEQDADETNGTEEIVWKVIGVEEGKALLLSKYCLDNVKYNEVYTEVTWKDCTLRKWLNEDFYSKVFSEQEKECIMTSVLTNEKDPRFPRNKDGENTEDKVFLLSLNEAERYLTPEEKYANATIYATKRGLSTAWKGECCTWHIRTAAAGGWNVGAYHAGGHWTQNNVDREYGLRPAVWVDLDMIK